MTNMIDYVKWRGDISFKELPLNEVDSLIFTELAYVPYDNFVSDALDCKGIPLSKLADNFFSVNSNKTKIGAIIPNEPIFELFQLTAKSKRFGNVLVRGYINEVDIGDEKQFSAMCFDIDAHTTYVAYRGTDDTIIGWKEDLNMAFFTPIPSQKRGAEYLESVGASTRHNLYIGGHSKGGNLAIYSALMANERVQKKIIAVHSFDGPGFKKEFIAEHKKNPILPRLIKILPEGAIIGAIFYPVGKCKYVKSEGKGLYQHDAFTWEVMGKDFITVREPSKTSTDFHNLLETWVDGMSEEEKVDFVDALYKLCTVNDSTTLSDIATDKLKFIVGVLKTDDKTKKTFLTLINRLIKQKYFKKDDSKRPPKEEKPKVKKEKKPILKEKIPKNKKDKK